MLGSSPKTSRPAFALLVGLAATAIVAAAHLLALDERAELLALDYRFRHFSSAPRSEDVVVVAIDDPSLRELGRLPWPREILAGIIQVLQECGARAVALDAIMPEPQETRYESAEAKVYDPDTAPLIGTAEPRPVFDDALLEEALRRGRVLLPIHVDFGRKPPPTHGRIDARVRDILQADPNTSFADVVRRVLGQDTEGKITTELEIAKRAYWRHRALHYLEAFSLPSEDVAAQAAPEGSVEPPPVRFARTCHSTGFVSFQTELDGVMRRVPLLARAGGRVYPQFALSVAADDLCAERGPTDVQAAGRKVLVRCAGKVARAIPLDRKGCLLINWAPAADGFAVIPAHSVGYVWQRRHWNRKNTSLSRLIALNVAQRLNQSDLLACFRDEQVIYRQRTAAQAARQWASLYEPNNVPPPPDDLLAEERRLEGRIDELAEELFKEETLDLYLGPPGAGDPNRPAVESLMKLRGQLAAANAAAQQELDQALVDLRRRVRGKICLVGSTATGAMDFVPTPVDARMPGVLVHANVLNTIASESFVREAPWGLHLAAIVLAGALVSLVGARLPVLQAGPLAALLVGGFAVVNVLVVFAWLGFWLVLVAPVASMIFSFLGVTAYRQSTEEREKRRIRAELAHTLSPAVMNVVLADPSQLDPRRRTVSCFFSDLRSFTALAERLGEQDTITVLRRYFDCMTDVIQNRYDGYLNKFLGDGILGFFGAPVDQEDHARRALAAASACLDEVEHLNTELAERLGESVDLSCRIGISAGPAMFGNCGSTDRSDYTAIGDMVNLASRLESANKQFGTRILVDQHVWGKGDDGTLLARPLGKLLVVGKTEPVGVWHVVAPMASASPEMRAAAAAFGEAVDLFARRRFAEAAGAFEAIRQARPEDMAAALFLSLCRQYTTAPPGEDWPGAVQLTEK